MAARRLRYSRARPLLRKLRTRGAALARPVRPVAANLAAMPMHVAGLGCIDFAAFHLAHGWGWLATGLSLIWL
ncbi:MAG: hypothetical protein ACRDOL_22675, partial [Streptosporangiaceae bacterium]